MRPLGWLLVALGVLSGCDSCAEWMPSTIEAGCPGSCLDAKTSSANWRGDVLKTLRTEGRCYPTFEDTCEGGWIQLMTGDGLCATTLQFSTTGRLVFRDTGCEARVERSGYERTCTPVKRVNLCEEALQTLSLVGAGFYFGSGPHELDGQRVTGPKTVPAELGTHRVQTEGADFEVDVGRGPGPRVLHVAVRRIPPWPRLRARQRLAARLAQQNLVDRPAEDPEEPKDAGAPAPIPVAERDCEPAERCELEVGEGRATWIIVVPRYDAAK